MPTLLPKARAPESLVATLRPRRLPKGMTGGRRNDGGNESLLYVQAPREKEDADLSRLGCILELSRRVEVLAHLR